MTVISVATTLVGSVAAGIIWVQNTVDSGIAPVQAQVTAVQAQTNANATAIAVEQNDVLWIKNALNDNGIRPRATATSTP